MKMEPEVKLEELPKRVKGGYLKNRTKDLKILSNYYPVMIKPFECLYIFKVVFEPKIANDNRVLREQLLKKALPSIKTQISNNFVRFRQSSDGWDEHLFRHQATGLTSNSFSRRVQNIDQASQVHKGAIKF